MCALNYILAIIAFVAIAAFIGQSIRLREAIRLRDIFLRASFGHFEEVNEDDE